MMGNRLPPERVCLVYPEGAHASDALRLPLWLAPMDRGWVWSRQFGDQLWIVNPNPAPDPRLGASASVMAILPLDSVSGQLAMQRLPESKRPEPLTLPSAPRPSMHPSMIWTKQRAAGLARMERTGMASR